MGRATGLLAATAALGAAAVFAVWRKKQGSKRPASDNRFDALETIALSNRDGVEVHITPVGASIQRFVVPVQGQKLDVVLGFNKASTYATIPGTPYFGAIVGRCANRIAKARFSVNGQEYTLEANNGPNALHGGPDGFHRRVWRASAVQQTAEGSAVELSYTSVDGEEGYPGTLQASVRYELLSHSAELRISISATTDKPTPVNIAGHSYFNLAGHSSGTILGHVVKLAADHYTPVDDTNIPTGEILPVAGTPFDFTTPHTVGERIDQLPNGYDHNLVLFGMGPQARFITRNQAVSSTPRLAATVTEPSTGLELQVLTTAPGMQFYTGGFLGGGDTPDAKDGAQYPRFAGLCIETQNFPDAINQPTFPSVLLQPGETYRHQIVYRLNVPPS
uniref:Aldose 1-epimerase n=1 Tax=Tetradesmus obliquus TaxID=3088 RepID=A0A383V4H7_TETOB|eukprot:jgi/Sobl393_1/10456/SZX59619.1